MTADEAVDCLHVFEARIRPLSEIEGETYMKQLKNPQDHFHEDEVLTAIGVIAERKARMAENGKTDYRFTMDDALRIVAQERLAAAARAKGVRPAAVESPRRPAAPPGRDVGPPIRGLGGRFVHSSAVLAPSAGKRIPA